MAQNVTINGVTYPFPETGEENWGDTVTTWAVNVSSGLLQKAGGVFTLTAEVDFGATYGIALPYIKSQDAAPAATGVLRLGNNEAIKWRNAADSDEYQLRVDTGDDLEYRGINLQPLTTRGDVIIRDASGNNVRLGIGGSGEVLKSDGTDVSWGALAGTGDVVGPGSATDNAIPRYDSTTGKLLQGSGVVIDDSDGVTGVGDLTTSGDVTTGGEDIGSRMMFMLVDNAYPGFSGLGEEWQMCGSDMQYDAPSDIQEAVMPRAGSIVGATIYVATDADTFTTCEVDYELMKNGVSVWKFADISLITATHLDEYATQARGVDTFIAGDKFHVRAKITSFSGVVAHTYHTIMLEVQLDT